MSVKENKFDALKFLLILLVIPLVILNKKNEKKRSVASVHKHNHSPKISYGKMRTGMFAKIIRINEDKESNPNVYHYSATINTKLNSNTAKYKWILPENSKLIDGEMEVNLSDFKTTDSLVITISFEQFEPKNKKVYLEVYSMVDGVKIGDIANLSLNESQKTADLKAKTNAVMSMKNINSDKDKKKFRILQ